MIQCIFTKIQIRTMWTTIKLMLREGMLPDKKEYWDIFDKLAKSHDTVKTDSSAVKMLFDRFHCHLLWSICKVAIDDGIITDTGKIIDLIDCMTVMAVGLEQ